MLYCESGKPILNTDVLILMKSKETFSKIDLKIKRGGYKVKSEDVKKGIETLRKKGYTQAFLNGLSIRYLIKLIESEK